MALSFNGTSDFASVAVDLSAVSLVSYSFWGYGTFGNDDHLFCEYTPNFNSDDGFLNDPDNSGTVSTYAMNMHKQTGGLYWGDHFTRPSSAAWHHYMFVHDRATPVNVAYVDGALQTLAVDAHNAGTYGNFANSTLYLMSRGGTSLFMAGRMAEYVLWTGVTLSAAQATQLANGAEPTSVQASPLLATIRRGQSTAAAEATDWSGNGHDLSVTGATFIADPPTLIGVAPVAMVRLQAVNRAALV